MHTRVLLVVRCKTDFFTPLLRSRKPDDDGIGKPIAEPLALPRCPNQNRPYNIKYDAVYKTQEVAHNRRAVQSVKLCFFDISARPIFLPICIGN